MAVRTGAEAATDAPEVVVITGVMAAGKSTVAQLLAERLERSVHLRGDLFRRMIVSGRAEPTPDMPVEATQQLALRYHLAAQVARTYAEAGFTVVYQDILLEAGLTDVLSLLEGLRRAVVVLNPSAAVVAQRDEARAKTGYGGGWTPHPLIEALERTPRVGLWLDTSELTPGQTVEFILARMDEARC